MKIIAAEGGGGALIIFSFIDTLSVRSLDGNVWSWLIFGGVKDNGIMETCNFILTAAICKDALFSSVGTTLGPIKNEMKCN